MTSVYIADEFPIIRTALRHQLGECEVVGDSGDATVALRDMKATRPDVAVMTLGLAGLNSFDLVTTLQADNIPTKVVIFDREESSRLIYRAVAVGARGFVLKSEPVQAICEAVQHVAKGKTWFSTMILSKLTTEIRDQSRLADPGLTPREHEVLKLLATGMTMRRIGETLWIAPCTVKTHLEHIYRKLGIRGQAAAVGAGYRLGLLD